MDPELQKWCDEEENLHAKIGDEYWKLNVGLPYSEDKIAELEKKGAEHGKLFLQKWKEPIELYESAVGSLVSERTFKLHLKLKELRKTKIVSTKHKFNGKPVTWETWRQFASQADDTARKEVFDEFITLVTHISPVIKENFETTTKIFSEYGLNPYEMYLRDHKMTHQQLKGFIEHLRDKVKKPFQQQFHRYCKEIFGRKPEYFDDFYAIRNKLFSKVQLPEHDPIRKVLQTCKILGFNTEKIFLDKEDRPDKYASPFCSGIKIPQDARVSFKAENPVNDLSSIYHEYGHALHFVTIDSKLPYWKRYNLSEGLCEVFSTLFELLIHDPHYLEHHFGFSTKLSEDLVARLNFSWTYAMAFYCANSLFRIEYWHHKVPHEKCDELYAKYIKSCTGMDIPGAYWQLHHILPESMMYVPSYMLAEARSTQIIKQLKEEFGKNWWEHNAAGIFIQSLMRDGADSPMGEFGNIKPDNLVEEVVNA